MWKSRTQRVVGLRFGTLGRSSGYFLMIQVAFEGRSRLLITGPRTNAGDLNPMAPIGIGENHPNCYRPVRFFITANNDRVPRHFLVRFSNPLTQEERKPCGRERCCRMAGFAPRLKKRTNRVSPIAQGGTSPFSRPLARLQKIARVLRLKETVEKFSQRIIGVVITYHFWIRTVLSAGRDASVCIQ